MEGGRGVLSISALHQKPEVINDTADRGIALIMRFAPAAKDDTEPQWLLQAVEGHRKRVNVMHSTRARWELRVTVETVEECVPSCSKANFYCDCG